MFWRFTLFVHYIMAKKTWRNGRRIRRENVYSDYIEYRSTKTGSFLLRYCVFCRDFLIYNRLLKWYDKIVYRFRSNFPRPSKPILGSDPKFLEIRRLPSDFIGYSGCENSNGTLGFCRNHPTISTFLPNFRMCWF